MTGRGALKALQSGLAEVILVESLIDSANRKFHQEQVDKRALINVQVVDDNAASIFSQ